MAQWLISRHRCLAAISWVGFCPDAPSSSFCPDTCRTLELSITPNSGSPLGLIDNVYASSTPSVQSHTHIYIYIYIFSPAINLYSSMSAMNYSSISQLKQLINYNRYSPPQCFSR